MFATPPPPPHYHDYYTYTPTRSSPLAASSSMSNMNMNMSFSSPIQPSQFSFATPPQQQQQQQHPTSTISTATAPTTPANYKTTPYAHRYATTIANPLNHTARRNGSVRGGGSGTSPTARATRRNLFLNRIKEDRDAGRFEARGEQLVLMEDVAEEKKWKESMGRRAERYMRGFGIGEDEIEIESGMDTDMDSTAQLDEFLSQEQEMERAEMMLFLAAEGADEQERLSQQQQEQQQQGQPPSLDTSISYSDDAEYDDIFADLADTVPQSQGMDMSSG